MADLLKSVSQVRKSLQKKRQLRSRDFYLNIGPLTSIDSDRSKTERHLRSNLLNPEKIQSIEVSSPQPPKKFEFHDSLTSPPRVRSYKIDAANLLISRLKYFLNKHFLIWKKKAEMLKEEENNIFTQKAWRLKVSVGKTHYKPREITKNNNMAGKIVRKSHDGAISKIISKIVSNESVYSNEKIPLIDNEERKISNFNSIENFHSYSSDRPNNKLAQINSIENLNSYSSDKNRAPHTGSYENLNSYSSDKPNNRVNYINSIENLNSYSSERQNSKVQNLSTENLYSFNYEKPLNKALQINPNENMGSYSNERVPNKIPIYPRTSLRKDERALEKIKNFTSKKVKNVWQIMSKKTKNTQKMFNFCEDVIRARFAQVIEDIKNYKGEVKKIVKAEEIEGCVQNLKKFINEKREKQKGKINAKKIKYEEIDMILKKMENSYNKRISLQTLEIIQKITKIFLFSDIFFSFSSNLQKNFLFFAWTQLKFYPKALKNNTRTLKTLVRNINKDIFYRKTTCFKYWKTITSESKSFEELVSLSAVSIHNILLNIINCRTRIFFSTCKLAMNKFKDLSEKKLANIVKAAKRINFFIRDKMTKPFVTWKVKTFSSIKTKNSKKSFGKVLQNNIMNLIFHKFSDCFTDILIFAKKKEWAVKVFNRIFKETLRKIIWKLNVPVRGHIFNHGKSMRYRK